ncbi:dehydrogenase [Paenibacillus baekrokdamisoli]|uniref:Dehydrogenase n=1 Tax=Paenibacillus baekrokdamisoli TaxID=1712516 RepID=A0A3G9IQK0_9BACL|nr:Gfo/Idh/MocA family oxidoreductase [Paenibacillus baekrokdamisoli]MBB3070129.1 putative dehydrogenase [Paenibacillus baekrokdamisoli]BBH21140.1 dehydrogenase [Paenibacillus baekrokdamisoli]
MIRIAMLSYWHVHAWDYTKQVQENPITEVVAVWDEIPARGLEAAAKLGVPFIADLDEILARADVDAVVVDTPTNIHRDVMVKAARAGKHIFTEKVVAPTLKEVNEILAAIREAGVKLTVSLPRLNDSYTLTAQEVISQGLLGQLTQARVRLSHNGATAGWLPEHFFNLEQCGGGALIDLGCHPMYLVRLFLGLPQSVHATFGYVSGKAVEDNAVATLRYENGAIGIVEAGFVNSHSPFSVEIHGTEGSLLYGLPDEVIRVRSNKLDASEWVTIEKKENRIPAFDQWVEHVLNGTEADENIGLAVDLTKLMEASNLSEAEKRSVSLSELQQ